MEHTLEMMVNAFTEAEDLMTFAATWDIQDLPVVRFRLYQLRNRENENQVAITEVTDQTEDNLALEYVREQEAAPSKPFYLTKKLRPLPTPA